MTITKEEAAVINIRLDTMESAVTKCAEACQSVAANISELLLEFKERDVRHEYEQKDHQELKDIVIKLNAKIDDYITKKAPIIDRAEKVQKGWDLFFDSIKSKAGIAVFSLLIIAVLLLLSVDLSKFTTKL